MKKATKILTILLLVVISILCFAVGCKKQAQQITLTTDKTEVNVSIEDTATVTVTSVGLDATKIIWKSQNEKVATVNSGVITPVSIGQTTVTVSYEEQVVAITVNVEDKSGKLPNLMVGEQELCLYEGDNFLLSPKLSWNGKEVPSNFDFKSSDSDKVSVSNDGTITANAFGSAVITVSAQYKGIAVKEEIIVKVVADAKAQIFVNGEQVTKQEVQMYVNDLYNFTIKTVYNEQEVTGLNYTLTTQNDKVDEKDVASGYSFQAKSLGQDRVTLSCVYNGVTISTFINVNVVVKNVSFSEPIYVDLSSENNGVKIQLPNEITLFDDTSISLSEGTKETVKELNLTEKYIVIDSTNIESGSYSAVIGNEYSVSTVPMCFVDKIIMQSDAQNFSSIINANLAGYYVLGEDIEFSNRITTIGKKVDGAVVTFEDFTGTFDGCGYAMTNVQIGAEGGSWYDVGTTNLPYRMTVFASLNGGTIRNLYVDYLAPTLAGINHLAFVGDCRGNIENVYVKLTIRSNISKDSTSAWGVAALVNRMYNLNGNKIRNCIGEVVLSNIDDTNPIVLSSLVGIAYSSAPLSNCYGVTNGINLRSHFNCLKKEGDGISCYYTNATIKFTNVSAVDSSVDLLGKTFNAEDGWSSLWQIKADGLYFGNKLIVSK